MININEVTRLVGVEAYRGSGVVAFVAEISAIVAARIGNSGIG